MKFTFLLTFLVLMLSTSSYSQQDVNKTLSLFTQPTLVQNLIESNSDELQKIAIQINDEILRADALKKGDLLRFELFSERRIEATVLRSSTDVLGTTAINAQLSGEIPGTLLITHYENRLFATLNLYDEDRLFYIKSDPLTGEHYLEEMDKSAMELLECGGVLTDLKIDPIKNPE